MKASNNNTNRHEKKFLFILLPESNIDFSARFQLLRDAGAQVLAANVPVQVIQGDEVSEQVLDCLVLATLSLRCLVECLLKAEQPFAHTFAVFSLLRKVELSKHEHNWALLH